MATKLDNREIQRKEREWQDDGKWRPLVLLSHLNEQASAEAFGSGADKTSGVQSAASSGECPFCVIVDGVVVAQSDGCTCHKFTVTESNTPLSRYAIGLKQKRRIASRVIKKKGISRPLSALGTGAADASRLHPFQDLGLEEGETPLSVTEVARWRALKESGDSEGAEGTNFDNDDGSVVANDRVFLNRSDNKFSPLAAEEELTSVEEIRPCKKSKKLKAQVMKLVEYFSSELGVAGDKRKVGDVVCGGVRSAVRSCFPPDLDVIQELSLKTSQKVEVDCCGACEPGFYKIIGKWKYRMAEPVEVDTDHLEKYKKAFRSNVPPGWNRDRHSYIPNGSATCHNPRTLGGNWNREDFSDTCSPALVFSSGKPRVVTCYSSYNNQVLSQLHQSLYSRLSRRLWLLKGDPTSKRVAELNGEGKFLSFDYIGATDNIKKEYVQAGIEILIEQADEMSDDEKRCLRVLGNLILKNRDARFEPEEGDPDFGPTKDFFRGQPMGCFMSFPLLCLTNKTIVDMSLTDLLERKEISFNEWTQHRCLINGDDLLLREPSSKSDLASRIVYNGGQVGMETNMDKCLRSESLAEVNSTLFDNSVHVKKTNAKALYMKADVEDVLGLAYDATTTTSGFVKCVRSNLGILKKQEDKFLWKLPYPYQVICKKNKKINKALRFKPLDKKFDASNYFPVVPRPAGYDLFPNEEREILDRKVSEIRDNVVTTFLNRSRLEQHLKDENRERKKLGLLPFTLNKKIRVVSTNISWRRLTKKKKKESDFILSVLAEAFQLEQRDLLTECIPRDVIEFKSGTSRIDQLCEIMRPKASSQTCVKLPSSCDLSYLRNHVSSVTTIVGGAFAYFREFQYFPRVRKSVN